jgi:hypothetical protein
MARPMASNPRIEFLGAFYQPEEEEVGFDCK